MNGRSREGSGLLQRTRALLGVSLSSCLALHFDACTAGRHCWRKQPQETQPEGGEVEKRLESGREVGEGRNGERERGRGREGGEWKVKERAGGDRWEKEGEIEPTCTHTYIPAASTPTSSAFTPLQKRHVHVACRLTVTQEAPSRNLQIKDQLGSISRQHAGKTRCILMVVAVETV